MSYTNYEKALERAKGCEYYKIGNGQPQETIDKAENLFGFKFSKQNYDYFKNLGYLGFFGLELYGIYDDNFFSGIPADSCIETALVDRKETNLPKEWLPIYFFDDGYMGYLDYSQLNEDSEPPVIMAIYNGEKYVVVERVAEDFGDFLLELVEQQLKYQEENPVD